jgi:hypothetical protein
MPLGLVVLAHSHLNMTTEKTTIEKLNDIY